MADDLAGATARRDQGKRSGLGHAAKVAFERLVYGKLVLTDLERLFDSLPPDFRLLIADVGSIGGLHRRWRSLGPRLATVSFDPLDQRQGTERDRVFPILLGKSEGETSLNITSRGSMSSTLIPVASFYEPFWNKVEDTMIVDRLTARTTSLDALAAREGLVVDAVKIDVQGGEGAVLAGASQLLARSIILAEIECSFAERYEGQLTFDQVVALMRGHGFALLDVRRLKRYRFRNRFGVEDPSLGRGMRAGRLAFCDAIFALEPQRLWRRIAEGREDGAEFALKAIVLFLIYGKADLAAATFERAQAALPKVTREAFERFFAALSGKGKWRHRLHRRLDRLAQQV